MAEAEGPPPPLVVRPVVEEFRAHTQEKISQLERAKKVDVLKVFLDAAELGVQLLVEAQMDSADEARDRLSAEAPAGEGHAPGAGEADEEPGVETEDLAPAEDAEPRPRAGQWNLPMGEEVLVGEDKAAAEPGTAEEAPPAGREDAAREGSPPPGKTGGETGGTAGGGAAPA